MGALRPLGERLANGDEESWKLAFALTAVTDGGDLEDLHAVMGGAVSEQPAMFLERAIARPGFGTVNIVGFLGADYSDQPERSCSELQRRWVAIRGVAAPQVAEARRMALSLLRARGRSEGCRRLD